MRLGWWRLVLLAFKGERMLITSCPQQTDGKTIKMYGNDMDRRIMY